MNSLDTCRILRWASCLALSLPLANLCLVSCQPPPAANTTGDEGTTDGSNTGQNNSDGNPSGSNVGDTGGNTGGDTNPPPPTVAAQAGPDQTVEDQATVTLSAQGSDSSGAAVSYAWIQVSGAVVTLTGNNSATATFTAPTQSGALVFRVNVHSPNGDAFDDVAIAVNAAPLLFIVNRGGNSIVRFRAGSQLNGEVSPLGLLAGANTRLNGPSSLQLDGIGGILVANADGNRVSGFLNAANINGDVTPERYVGGVASKLNIPEGVAYSPAGGLLLVSNFDSFPGTVNVYGGVNTASFTADVAPVRQIRSIAINDARDIMLTPADDLYVVNAGAQNISVFAGASSADGDVSAARTIRSTEFADSVLLGAFVDTQDHLFVADSSHNRVLIFTGAASLDGEVSPAGTITIPGAGQLTGVVVDSRQTGYVTDAANNSVYIYDSLATRRGTVAPDRTLAGAKTQLSQPWHMVLLAH